MSREQKIEALKERIQDNEAVIGRVRAAVAHLEKTADTEMLTRASAFSEKLLDTSSKTIEAAGDILFDPKP